MRASANYPNSKFRVLHQREEQYLDTLVHSQDCLGCTQAVGHVRFKQQDMRVSYAGQALGIFGRCALSNDSKVRLPTNRKHYPDAVEGVRVDDRDATPISH